MKRREFQNVLQRVIQVKSFHPVVEENHRNGPVTGPNRTADHAASDVIADRVILVAGMHHQAAQSMVLMMPAPVREHRDSRRATAMIVRVAIVRHEVEVVSDPLHVSQFLKTINTVDQQTLHHGDQISDAVRVGAVIQDGALVQNDPAAIRVGIAEVLVLRGSIEMANEIGMKRATDESAGLAANSMVTVAIHVPIEHLAPTFRMKVRVISRTMSLMPADRGDEEIAEDVSDSVRVQKIGVMPTSNRLKTALASIMKMVPTLEKKRTIRSCSSISTKFRLGKKRFRTCSKWMVPTDRAGQRLVVEDQEVVLRVADADRKTWAIVS